MESRFNVFSLKSLFVVSALAATIASAGLVSTASASDEQSVTVSYADLHLDRPADVKRLYQRLDRAAANVCGDIPRQDLERYAGFRRCHERALEAAVQQVRSPELLAYERAHNSPHS